MASIKVTLGGVEYDVPKMNIGQLEAVSDAFQLPMHRRAFGVLRIGMSRAVPKIADVNAIEASDEEIAAAVKALLSNAGYKSEGGDPNPDAPNEGAES